LNFVNFIDEEHEVQRTEQLHVMITRDDNNYSDDNIDWSSDKNSDEKSV